MERKPTDHSDRLNILMVDDQPGKLLSYEAILADLGENLIKAGSAREALEYLLKTEIAVVLMDVSMPELDGFELADIIRQHPRYQRTAIIFVSGVHLTDLDQLKGYERGAVDYVSVPVIPQILRAKVGVFIELYRKKQQLEEMNQELERRVWERTEELEQRAAELERLNLERERLIERERAAREIAEAHNRAKDDFLSVVTHELRSPLNAILGYTRLARSDADDPVRVRQHCDIIERAARTQQRLIDDLLDTARIINGKLRIDALPCDLRLMLEEALAVVQPAADAKGIALMARLSSLSRMVVGDPARLQQVVWNLLQNAIKFTPTGGRVELQMELMGEHVQIIVRDNGKGIEPEFLPAVFDRFSQNDMSRARRHGGLGLGLALVKQLIELHGGEIEAASQGAGHGAAFTVRLPLHAPRVEIPRPVRAVSTEVRVGEDALSLAGLPSLAGVSVLAVDDQEEARHLIVEVLKEQGATITAVSSGLEALAFLANPPPGAKPDVLILDIAMPDEDGYSVLRRVRKFETEHGAPAIPAIALTSHTSSQDRLAALSAGFQMHVGKPVELAELVLVIVSLVEGKRKGANLAGKV